MTMHININIRYNNTIPIAFSDHDGDFQEDARIPRQENRKLHESALLFAQLFALACLHGIHTLSVTHYAYVTNLISFFVASFSEMSTGTWESRLQDALGPGGYKNSMKRSLQTVILYEAVSSSPGTGVSHPSSICIVTSLTTDH